jgi:hypothetical protein
MPQKYFPVKAFGVETQVPRWAVTALALCLVVGAVFTVYRIYAEPERQLLSLRDANRQLAAEVEEYSLHVMEEPQKHELFEEQDGRLILRVFRDHCVLIQRQTRNGTRTKLVLDLARAVSLQREAPAKLGWVPVAQAQQACQRGCLNPHPGEFRWWYGQRSGDWVEVWRQWPEGCTHFQMFNVQTRAWDSNPDGSAKVRWTCCVH